MIAPCDVLRAENSRRARHSEQGQLNYIVAAAPHQERVALALEMMVWGGCAMASVVAAEAPQHGDVLVGMVPPYIAALVGGVPDRDPTRHSGSREQN